MDPRPSPLFARPNLKLFVLAALLLLVISELIQPGHSEVTVWRVSAREPASATALAEQVQRLTEQFRARPSSALCAQIAECHRLLGRYKEAARWLRRADLLGWTVEEGD